MGGCKLVVRGGEHFRLRGWVSRETAAGRAEDLSGNHYRKQERARAQKPGKP